MRSTTITFGEGPAPAGRRIKAQDGTETITLTGLTTHLADKITTVMQALDVTIETSKATTEQPAEKTSPKPKVTDLSEHARAEIASIDQQRALDRWAETGVLA
ncbi:hypothetical protein [Mobilicoccus pelagius]|uniref:Uncharacterized protein n=1 Tax=Mobilicoccus pelagius NBRC 104925 TaxID=1089455 RepID=H5UN99_9MICO|nr:hypothetical protein [Mobilicoccus pelagius]GAB47207.1 hypothetical protein MOPEL_007_00240 [Mobilicoccus pelagius NBRC 104925]